MEYEEAVKISKLYFQLKELSAVVDEMIEPVKTLERENYDLRNFACQLCGKYKTAHEGSCRDCRWRKME